MACGVSSDNTLSFEAAGLRTVASWILLSLASLIVVPAIALAQDSPQDISGANSAFTIDLTALSERNGDLDPGVTDVEHRLEARLGYGLSFATATQSFDLDLAGSYAVSQSEGSADSGFERPSAALTYGLEGSRFGLTAAATYRETDVSDLSLVLDDSGTISLFEGQGTRGLGTAQLGFDGGRDRPLRYRLDLSGRSIRYSGTTSSSYYDSDTYQAVLGAALDVAPRATLTFEADYKDYRADNSDETQRETVKATLGAEVQLDEITTLRLSFGQSRIDTEEVSGNEIERGTVGSIALTREDRLGDYRLSYDHSLSSSGARDTVRISRNRDFATGDLSASLGLTQGEDGDTTWVSAVALSLERPRGGLDMGLNRAVSTDDDGFDVTVTRATMGWSHMLTKRGTLSLDLAARLTEEEQGLDTERYDITLAWAQELRRDVVMRVGGTLRLAAEEGTEDARSEQVFFTLSRSFSGRPFFDRP